MPIAVTSSSVSGSFAGLTLPLAWLAAVAALAIGCACWTVWLKMASSLSHSLSSLVSKYLLPAACSAGVRAFVLYGL